MYYEKIICIPSIVNYRMLIVPDKSVDLKMQMNEPGSIYIYDERCIRRKLYHSSQRKYERRD